MPSLRLTITGRVQGVGYRYALADAAERLGVGGWVRNRADRSVEAVVHGDAESLRRLVDWARHGPPAARVDEVRTEPGPEDERATRVGLEIRPNG